jgi:hypothetical protein
MSVPTWIAIGVVAWCVISVPLGILIGKCINFGMNGRVRKEKNETVPKRSDARTPGT